MANPTRRFGFWVALLVAAAHGNSVRGAAPGAAPAGFEAGFRAFADAHCTSCHGPDVQRARLRLDTLKADLDDKDNAAVWVKILDQIAAGEMPPKGKPRPAAEKLASVVNELRRGLHDASLAKQKREGRVALRRLNRTEYETTLSDLLGAPFDFKDVLPDDNTAAGFDNVAAALDISPVHLLRYQEAAERAVRSVIPNRPKAELKVRQTGRQITETMKLFAPMLGKSARLDGDTLVLFVRPYGHIPCATVPAPVAGRYRVRAMVSAINSDGKPLPIMCVCRDQYGREDHDVRAVRDVPADKPTVIEGEYELKPRQVIVFQGWSLPGEREFSERNKGAKAEGYAGPGLAVHWLEIEGPLDPWPPAGYQRLFGGVPLKPQSVARAEAEGRPVPPQPAKRPDQWWIYDPLVVAPAKPKEDSERLVRAFLPLAFRRPVADDLARYFVGLAHAELDKRVAFPEAMITAYKAVLCSPHFLFLTERVGEPKPGRAAGLDEYAVASRLSYFLWSSPPDEELIGLAAKGDISKPEVLQAQVERMLADPKAKRFTANFAGQWLDLRNINATSPDPQIYGEFDDFLFWSMPRETEMFFEEVLRGDRPLTEFVQSDWTPLNQRLAKHYGIPGVFGGELRVVKLPAGCGRGGVLTQAAVLKVTADGTRTSPVIRGKWVLDRILGRPPSPPPPGTPTIEPDIRGATTIRQQLDKHRHTPACASCHRHIDPPGFALEGYDVIGGRRDFYRATRNAGKGLVDVPNYPGRKVFRGPDVEAGGETPDGRRFADADEYKRLLLADKDQLARSLAQKLIVFATGADIQFADREAVEAIVAKVREKNYGFRTLVQEVVQSRIVLNK